MTQINAEKIRERLVTPMPNDKLVGWLGALFVGAIAAGLRLINLDRPHRIIFDETYYAKDAFSLLTFGYERDFVDDANEKILEGNLDVFTDEPSFIVHPPIGKWLIALGIRLFGMEPVGWRIAPAIAGILTVIVVARAGRRLFRSTLLGCAAGLLLAVEGLSIVMSRTAILDGILTLFIVAAFAFLLVDRDKVRKKYADWVTAQSESDQELGDGPVFGWRPWRLAAGVALGLACATKWSGLYALAIFGLMTVLWDISARRAAGIRSPVTNALLRDGPIAFPTIVGPALVTYVTSWWGWIASSSAWSRDWAAQNPTSGLAAALPDWVRSLWHYHYEMWNFHTGLSKPHDYASQAWSWLIMKRPVSFDYKNFDQGEADCTVEKCSQAVLALGNPVLWWASCLALLVCLWWWFFRNDWRPGAILAGVIATWVPWLVFTNRTIFAFYAVVIAPFLVLAVTFVLHLIIGRPGADKTRQKLGIVAAWLMVMVIVLVAAWFYPIHVDEVIPHDDWRQRMWNLGFNNWI